MAGAAVYVLAQQGAIIARAIAASMDIDLYMPPSLAPANEATAYDSLRELVDRTFAAYRRHVFITSAGVAVRCIAPHLNGAPLHPAVAVLDHHGKHVVSLLSGHLESGNALARAVSEAVGGRTVITTATDAEHSPALDLLALERGMAIANLRAVPNVNAALLRDGPVIVADPRDMLNLRHSAWKTMFAFTDAPDQRPMTDEERRSAPKVTVTAAYVDPHDNHLVLRPKILHVGVDCRLGAKGGDILRLIDAAFDELELATVSIARLAAADSKRHEPGLREAAETLGASLRFFPARELDAASAAPRAPEAFGMDGGCEAAALLSAGNNAVIRLPRRSGHGIAIAVAEEGAG